MLIAREKDNIVVAQKVPERLEPASVTANQKQSYNKFLTSGIGDAVKEITLRLAQLTGKNITSEYRIDDRFAKDYIVKEIKRQIARHYEVYVRFAIDGVAMAQEVKLVNIPYADEYNVLNVGGARRVLIGKLDGLEDVSFTHKPNMLEVNVVLPTYQFRIRVKSDSVVFVFNQKEYVAADVLDALYYETGYGKRVSEIFTNSFILRSMSNPDHVAPEIIYANIQETRILDSLKRDIGPLRQSLDEMLRLDSALNEVLSRDVVLKDGRVIPKGKVLDKRDIIAMRKDGTGIIYIKRAPSISGRYAADDILIPKLPKGIAVNDLIRDLLPQFKTYRFLPADVQIDYFIKRKSKLTPDMMEILYKSGVESINILKSKSDTSPLHITFEQEVMTNYQGMFFDDYNLDTEQLTVHDLAALVSYSVRVYTGQVTDTFNRDSDFLKKISLANEIFTNTLIRAFNIHIKKPNYLQQTLSFINESIKSQTVLNRNNPFRGLVSTWNEELSYTKLMRPIEDVNPISLLSQTTRVASIVQSKQGVSDSQRTLALPFYGRLCPYETPQGNTIGLVNHLAIGCQVKDSVPLTPYFRIVRRNNQFLIDFSKPEMLSPKDELKGCRIGDIMSLDIAEDGSFTNKKVIARIPAADNSDERMSVASVDAYTLTHINAIPEQHLSPATMMIPFAGADDGARIQFGISLLKHSLYLKDSQVPYVMTKMYEDIYKHMGYYTIRAKESGEVISISTNQMFVRYDGDSKDTCLDFKESQVSNNSITTLNVRIGVGERFEKEDILIDSSISREGFFSPGRNALVGYICDEGWNYEDAIVMSETTSHDFTSLGVSVQKRKFKEDIKSLQNSSRKIRLSSSNLYTYIPVGGTLAQIIKSRINEEASKSDIEKIPSKEKGILYDLTLEQVGRDKELKATLVGFNRTRVADKLSGRHGNKGVDSIIKDNSEMPQFLNGVTLEMVLNPCGVVSRMNIGQLLEAHLGFIGYLLGIRFQSNSFNGASTDEIRMLMKFVHRIANGASDSAVRAEFGRKIPEFIYERAQERLEFIQEWEGCFTEEGTAPMYNPKTGKMFENPITFGYAYMIKTTEEVEHKIHARSGPLDDSEYLRTTKQPTEGSSKGGGQRAGEMELAVLTAHGAVETVYEMITLKSDDVPQRINKGMEILGMEPIFDESEYLPHSVDIFRYYMEAGGIFTESSAFPGYSNTEIENRRDFDFRSLRNQTGFKSSTVEKQKNKQTDKDLDEMDFN